MSRIVFFSIAIILLFALSGANSPERIPARETSQKERIDSIYMALDTGDLRMPAREVFARAMSGFYLLANQGHANSNTLSIVDFSLPSTEKRLWVIDLKSGRILHHSLVAHGKNSGDLYARVFSNKRDSYQSSLGFYFTGETYMGKHGLSLKLHGLEPGINDLAEARAIVIHGADYVDDQYAKRNGRLGRSWGCPAIPMKHHKEIIDLLAGGTCLFIYYPDQHYLSQSRLAGA